MDTSQKAEQWKKMYSIWTKVTPPCRPSEQDIEIFEEAIKKRFGNTLSQRNALILGATTMFRDMLSKLQLPTVVFDINKEMIDALGSICVQSKRLETQTVGNWLTTTITQKFDLILSDFSINNVPKDQWNTMLARINTWLTPDGIFINRSYNPPRDLPTIDTFKKKWFGVTMTDAQINEAWWDEVFYYCYDPTAHEEHNHWRKKFYDVIDDGSQQAKSYIAQMTGFFELFEKTWWLFPIEEERKMLSSHFHIIDESYAKDHSHAYHCPIYILEAK